MKQKYARPGFPLLAVVAALAMLPALTVSQGVFAADSAAAKPLGAIERAEAKRAGELLGSAVDYLQKNGAEKAYAAFNDPKGRFVKGPYYVYAVGTDGFMYANGGSGNGLVGKNEIDLHDAAGKPIIADLVEQAQKRPAGTVEYRWLNRVSNHLENKVSVYRKVGDVILAVGYYTPRATMEQAQDLLDRAVAYVRKSGKKAAFAAFNNPHGGFVRDDQYVFVVGLEDGKYRASGASPQLTGKQVSDMHDAAGEPLFQDMIALAKTKGSGTVDYVWRNPATNAVETKHTLIQRVDDVLLGVGYYTK